MRALSECRLYTFVDTAYLNGRSPAALARELCEGGSDIIQLRAKGLDACAIRAMAQQILPVLNDFAVPLVINDHPVIARETGAAYAHLGQEDFFDGETPDCDGVKIGLSSHEPSQARRALQAGPAYIAIGPVYATPTKPSAPPVTLSYVGWAAENVQVPWFAIGGINLSNIAAVVEAGATRVCVVSAILNAPDVRKTCQIFKERLTSRPL